VHAFKRDCKDEARKGIQMETLPFYYNKYYKKSINPKTFACADFEQIVRLIEDTIIYVPPAASDSESKSDDKILESMVSDELLNNEVFLKLTEHNRLDRQRRVDAGDSKYNLKFLQPQQASFAKGAASKSAPSELNSIGAAAKAGGAPAPMMALNTNEQGMNMALGALNGKGMNMAAPNGQGMNMAGPNMQGMNMAGPNGPGMNMAAPNGQGMNMAAQNWQGMNAAAPNQGMMQMNGQGNGGNGWGMANGGNNAGMANGWNAAGMPAQGGKGNPNGAAMASNGGKGNWGQGW